MNWDSPASWGNLPVWNKYQLGFICEEIHLTSLGYRSKVQERVHFSESERAMQN